MGKLSRNRFWIWNKYTKELTLKMPLSLFVIFFAAIAALELIIAIVGGIISVF
jgi:hypothetical protein